MPNQKSMDESRAFNTALDKVLRLSGLVNRELYLRFRDAYTYQAASTVHWVEAELEILLCRIDQGLPVSLFSPTANEQDLVETRAAFEQWVEANFPGIRD